MASSSVSSGSLAVAEPKDLPTCSFAVPVVLYHPAVSDSQHVPQVPAQQSVPTAAALRLRATQPWNLKTKLNTVNPSLEPYHCCYRPFGKNEDDKHVAF